MKSIVDIEKLKSYMKDKHIQERVLAEKLQLEYTTIYKVLRYVRNPRQ